MFELSFPQDRCWKITALRSDYFLREYNDEITGYSDGLRNLAPDVIHYGGNAYYVIGKFAQQQGWDVEQCHCGFVPEAALSERKKDEGGATNPIHSDEGPQCPYCNCVITPDDNLYYDEHRYTQDKCPECGKIFSVRVDVQVSWICAPIEGKEKGDE